jgi:hypothetical protein
VSAAVTEAGLMADKHLAGAELVTIRWGIASAGG